MRLSILLLGCLLVASCSKEPVTKDDDSLTADMYGKHIQQLKYDATELPIFDYIKGICDTPKQECKETNTVYPNGTTKDCVTLVNPQCSQLQPIAQAIADTLAGCNGNYSSFCAEFIQHTQTLKLADLPKSTQSTYGFTLDTPYFHGSQWDYRAEVYPMALQLLEIALYGLVLLPWVYFVVRYYLRHKPIIITAPPLPSEPEPAEPDAMALKTQQEAQEAAERLEAVRKQAEQEKREIEALKAAEEAKKQKAMQLAKEREEAEEQAKIDAIVADLNKLL
jgi:hypothetical protein